MVTEGIKPRNLRLAAGHIPGTAFPDEAGNVGIAGHRDMFFRELRDIREGDIIIFITLARSPQYSVEWTRVVKPKDVDVLNASGQSVLTLVHAIRFTMEAQPRQIDVASRTLVTRIVVLKWKLDEPTAQAEPIDVRPEARSPLSERDVRDTRHETSLDWRSRHELSLKAKNQYYSVKYGIRA